MVDTYQVVLGAIAVSIMVLIPIFCVFVWDLLAGRWDASIKRWREKRAADAAHRKGVRALKTQQGIPIEQLAADLRRLRALLGKDEHRSAAHQIGNRLAYDRLMIQICEMLDIEHELGGNSIGVERDIERFRVEAELERAGVVLTDRRYGQAA
jgi:ABC-type phosphate transport system auxiliary subunit